MTRALSSLTESLGPLYGGDYNPEQWPREVWAEDIRLMREAGVNLVTVGVFSWSRLEPRPGAFEAGWLDEILDGLGAAGIGVDLATPVASPPPWLGHLHPETLPVDEAGVRLVHGSRSHFCPSSPAYREAAQRITARLAERYSGHAAVRMWHAGNEYGQHCWCDISAEGFRSWLRSRYGTIEALNAAWSTVVWAQEYGTWEEILPPRRAPYLRNPAHELDFRRFGSDELLTLYREQRDEIRRFDRSRPVTTNLMGFSPVADYGQWAAELDIIADDAYPDPGAPDGPAEAALGNHLARGLARGPWMRMEQAASAVSWREHNLPKSPARLRLEILQAAAHGCDAALFFQWRQSRSGPERFHSAMLPLAGVDTAVHRGIRRIGAELPRIAAVVGTDVDAPIAILWDWPSWWAATQDAMPTARLDPMSVLRSWHRALWERGVVADVVPSSTDLADYRAVLLPALYLIDEPLAARLRSYVAEGGTLLWGPLCGAADTNAALWPGRSPALVRDVLGVSAEEWAALPEAGVSVVWDDALRSRASLLGERSRCEGAELVAAFDDGDLRGAVAISRNTYGDGAAWYVGTVLGEVGVAALFDRVLDDAAIRGAGLPPGVEAVLRGEALFLLNHGVEEVRVDARGIVSRLRGAERAPGGMLVDLLSGGRWPAADVPVPGEEALVLSLDAPSPVGGDEFRGER